MPERPLFQRVSLRRIEAGVHQAKASSLAGLAESLQVEPEYFLKMMRLIETIFIKRKKKKMDQIFQVKKLTSTRKAEEIEAQVVLTFAINDQKEIENLFELVS